MKTFFKTSAYILLYLVIYFMYQIIFMFIGSIIALTMGMKSDKLVTLTVPILFPSAIISLIFYWLILKYRNKNIIEYCRFKKISSFQTLLIVLIIICMSVIVQVAMGIFVNYFPSYNEVNDTMTQSLNNIFSIFCVTVFIPIFEEILFRGIILNDLLEKINVYLAIVIDGIIFGVYHFNLLQSIYAGFLGIILGFIYVWTRSIISTITAHITFNICGVILIPNIFSSYPQYAYKITVISLVLFILGMFLFYKQSNKNIEEF